MRYRKINDEDNAHMAMHLRTFDNTRATAGLSEANLFLPKISTKSFSIYSLKDKKKVLEPQGKVCPADQVKPKHLNTNQQLRFKSTRPAKGYPLPLLTSSKYKICAGNVASDQNNLIFENRRAQV